jgi:hypothetical protein
MKDVKTVKIMKGIVAGVAWLGTGRARMNAL